MDMSAVNIWEKANELIIRIFETSSGLELPKGSHWLSLMAVSLSQANMRLHSVKILLDMGHFDDAVILTRSLFELDTNVAYIAKDIANRLPQYLKHGGISANSEEMQKLQQEIDGERQMTAKKIVPGRAWKPLKQMCRDLGTDWLKEYETFYRYASVPTHAGSFTLGRNFKQLLKNRPLSDMEKCGILLAASDFHLRVTDTAATTFPEKIDFETVHQLQNECKLLGQELVT
jgi:hypothetical protein